MAELPYKTTLQGDPEIPFLWPKKYFRKIIYFEKQFIEKRS